jgi:hypothetical protein
MENKLAVLVVCTFFFSFIVGCKVSETQNDGGNQADKKNNELEDVQVQSAEDSDEVRGEVWVDINRDGVFNEDIDDVKVENVQIILYSDDTGLIATAATDVSGFFAINISSPDGSPYWIEVVLPDGYDFCKVEDFGESDCDINPATGKSEQFTPTANGREDSFDFSIGLIYASNEEENIATESQVPVISDIVDKEIRGQFSYLSGDCGRSFNMSEDLLISIDGSVITLEITFFGDVSVGEILPSGTFVAEKPDYEFYEGFFASDWTGQATYKFIDAGCITEFFVTFSPPSQPDTTIPTQTPISEASREDLNIPLSGVIEAIGHIDENEFAVSINGVVYRYVSKYATGETEFDFSIGDQVEGSYQQTENGIIISNLDLSDPNRITEEDQIKEWYASEFNISFANQDVERLLDLLHPQVLMTFSEEACNSYLEQVVANPIQVEVLELQAIENWDWVANGESINFPNARTVQIRITAAEEIQVEQQTHLIPLDNGHYGWLTICNAE